MSETKSLPERIAARLAARQILARGRTRAIVYSLREDLVAARDCGFSIKQAWETLVSEGTLAVSYDAFRRLANELALRTPGRSPSTRARRRDAQATPKPARTFDYSPTPNPKTLV